MDQGKTFKIIGDFVKSLAELGQAPSAELRFIATTKITKKHEEKE